MCREDYPEKLIRGISDKNTIDENREPSSSLFHFKKNSEEEDLKNPKIHWELSINWFDSDEAITNTLNQPKTDGNIQFKVGYVVLLKQKIDEIKNGTGLQDNFYYNRAPIVEPYRNPFHGNLLLNPKITTSKMKSVAGQIALHFDSVIIRDDLKKNKN